MSLVIAEILNCVCGPFLTLKVFTKKIMRVRRVIIRGLKFNKAKGYSTQ